ncbi:LysR substrate-binding domain-containing protein [Consotaella aegiceratis]|uniref:LysR substrate-binding domain-containing protein n=1 Tax=Consotaella aegiceratis TaxID=3097961 RepID=UPI002F402371
MAKPNVRQIEAFNAVMKSGSVTKAAESLFVSQPAVSKLVHAFELSCGFPLFSRATGRLVPTPEARLLFVETERLETGVVRVQKAAETIRDLERGEVSVVAFPGISMHLVPRAAARFLQDRSEVRLSLLTRTSRSIEDAILSRSADFGISLIPTDHPALRCERFHDVSMICALPAGHPLAQQKRISFSALSKERLVALGRDDLSYQLIASAFEKAGVEFKATTEVQMADAACAMVSAGYGIAVITSLMAVRAPDPAIVFRPLESPVIKPMWLITSSFGEISQLAKSLAEIIRQSVAALEDDLARA